MPRETPVLVPLARGRKTWLVLSRRKWLPSVCVEVVALLRRSASCSAFRLRAHSFHSYLPHVEHV